jgi:hypothetical protein
MSLTVFAHVLTRVDTVTVGHSSELPLAAAMNTHKHSDVKRSIHELQVEDRCFQLFDCIVAYAARSHSCCAGSGTANAVSALLSCRMVP